MAVLLLLLAAGSSAVLAAPVAIEIVLSKGDAPYRKVAETIENAVSADKTNIVIHTIDDDPEDPGYQPDIAIAVGAKATRHLLQRKDKTPVIATLIPRLVYRDIMEEHAQNFPKYRRVTAAVFLDQSPGRQIRLGKRLVKRSQIGVIPVAPGRDAIAKEYKEAGETLGVEIHQIEVPKERDFVDQLRTSDIHAEIVYGVFDPKFITRTSIKQLIYYSFHKRMALIGYSHPMSKAGALASIYSTPEQVGKTAGKLVHQWLQKKEIKDGEQIYPDEYVITCNEALFDYLAVFPSECPVSVD